MITIEFTDDEAEAIFKLFGTLMINGHETYGETDVAETIYFKLLQATVDSE
jgi:hypothetical protein